MATPAIVKIENGIAKIYDSKGNYIQMLQATAGQQFVSGNVTTDGIHFTTDRGNVQIYDLKMQYKKTIS